MLKGRVIFQQIPDANGFALIRTIAYSTSHLILMSEDEVLVSDKKGNDWSKVPLALPVQAKLVGLIHHSTDSDEGVAVIVLWNSYLTVRTLGDLEPTSRSIGLTNSSRFVLAEGRPQSYLLAQYQHALCIHSVARDEPPTVVENVFGEEERLSLSSAVVVEDQITFLIHQDLPGQNVVSRLGCFDLSFMTLRPSVGFQSQAQCLAKASDGNLLIGGDMGLFSCSLTNRQSELRFKPELNWGLGEDTGSIVSLAVEGDRLLFLSEHEDGVSQPRVYQKLTGSSWVSELLDFDDYISGSLLEGPTLLVFSSVQIKEFRL